MTTRNSGRDRQQAGAGGEAMPRPGRLLPDWRHALVVVAHPDDETFGPGAIADSLAAGGAAVHVLCFTHGEASTLNENHAELSQARDAELRQAAAELGAATVTLLDYPDGHLADIAPDELSAQVTRLPRGPAPRACWSSTTPASPAIPTTRPPPAPPCSPRQRAACPSWPGRCRTRSQTGSGPRPAAHSRASHLAGSICASGWTGPGSAALP